MSTPTTHSARVCTAAWHAEVDELAALNSAAPLGHDHTMRLFLATGSADFLPNENCDRRFWAFAPVAPSDVPPPGAIDTGPISLAAIQRAVDICEPCNNDMVLISDNASTTLTASRHVGDWEKKWVPGRIGSWSGMERRRDEAGMEWCRTVQLIANDFGWLVEVPTC